MTTLRTLVNSGLLQRVSIQQKLKSGSSNTTSNQRSEKVSMFSQYFKNAIKSLKQLSIPLINLTWKCNKRLATRTISKFSMTRISKSHGKRTSLVRTQQVYWTR